MPNPVEPRPAQRKSDPNAGAAKARAERALLATAQARVANAWLRMAGCAFVAFAAVSVTGDASPIVWFAGLAVVLLIEQALHRRLALRCAAGRAPTRLRGLLAWTALQSAYTNFLALLLWFAPYAHGRTLAVLFLIAGLANAAATLRAHTPFALAGLLPTMAYLLGLPVAEFVLDDARQPMDLMPMIGGALFLAFGANLWSSLRTADAAQSQAEAALARERQTAELAALAEADALARADAALRAPIAALAGAIEQMKRTAAAPEARNQIAAVSQSLESVECVVADMSAPDRLAYDQVELRVATVDPRQLVRAAVSAFRPAAHDKGLELFLDLSPEAPAAIAIDAARVRQTLSILLSNAIKFTTHGGVRVRLVSQPTDRAGRVRLAVVVADTGCGMSRSQLALMFAAAPSADESLEAGTGMLIARKLARAMGAKLTGKSELGVGSVFSLILEAQIAASERRSAA